MANGNEAKYTELESMTDEQLCLLAGEGNRYAEEILVARHHRLVRSCARPYFLAGGDNEDLLQEGMFGLLKAIREYDQTREASFQTFAGTCIRHRLYSVLKAASSGKHVPLNQSVPLNPSFFDANPAFAQVDPEVLLIDREKAASLLQSTRKQLSEFEVKILGYYLDGLTCREIAETVGKSPKSVDNAVQRIRRKVARYLSAGDISIG
ncbi:MAG: sigma-70 family RNA polymerase sigma factor [Ruminococcaceae bacterium]|nr:sigma-70 family RNA polymerase sigma factor [Oscillospiraceae bacterium]